jgi:hypothetical protein
VVHGEGVVTQLKRCGGLFTEVWWLNEKVCHILKATWLLNGEVLGLSGRVVV